MSPEQAEGLAIDARTDLWSLGAMLYESLSGRPPFEGNSGVAVLRAVTTEPVKSVRQLRPDIPEEAERIVRPALTRDQGRRYQTAAEMKNDLSAALAKLSAIQTHEMRISRAK